MTPTEIETIKQRAEAATPGPWEWHEDRTFVELRQRDVKDHHGIICIWWSEDMSESPEKEDGDFIAHAREDVDTLLEEVEKRGEMLESLYEWTALYPEERRQLFADLQARGLME